MGKITPVTRISAGNYDVTFEKSLPNGSCAVVTPISINDVVSSGASISGGGTIATVVTKLWIPGNGNFSSFDYGFYLQVVGRP